MSKIINYKEKYEKALERARVYWENDNDNTLNIKAKGTMEYLFPELDESEDDKIIKALIEYFNEQCDMSDWNGVYGYQVVKWLEKVSKDNKFLKSVKVGDIITKTPDGILINLGQSDKALEHSDKVEPKSDWSEEDEKIQNTTISFLSEYAAKGYENTVMCIDWLKSLKQKIE